MLAFTGKSARAHQPALVCLAGIMATVRCGHCQKRLADASWALKAHAWAKPACRVSVPESMRLEIEEEERQQPSDTSAFHCPGCGKSLANGGEALKAHAWSRAQCRRRIPAEMRAEIEEEEALLNMKLSCRGSIRRANNIVEVVFMLQNLATRYGMGDSAGFVCRWRGQTINT